MVSFEYSILEALEHNDVKTFCTLVTKENVNTAFVRANTILYQAAYYKRVELMRYCIFLGANIDYAVNEYKWTPLHIAARRGVYEGVKLLLDYGANVNALTLHGSSAISTATLDYSFNKNAIVKLLIDRGCQPSKQQLKFEFVNKVVTNRNLRHNILDFIAIFKYKLQHIACSPLDINVVRLIGKHLWSHRFDCMK